MREFLKSIINAATAIFSVMVVFAFLTGMVLVVDMPTNSQGRRACEDIAGDSVEVFAECLEAWREHRQDYMRQMNPFGE